MKLEGEYLNGERWSGKGKEYYSNGKVKFEGEYLDGKKWNGKEKEYESSGKLKFEGVYLDGKRNIFNNTYDYQNHNISNNPDKNQTDMIPVQTSIQNQQNQIQVRITLVQNQQQKLQKYQHNNMMKISLLILNILILWKWLKKRKKTKSKNSQIYQDLFTAKVNWILKNNLKKEEDADNCIFLELIFIYINILFSIILIWIITKVIYVLAY